MASILAALVFVGTAVAAERVVGVIDFRNEKLSKPFREQFERTLAAELRGSGVTARVRFERAERPRGPFDREIARLEAQRPEVYYATTSTIARAIRKTNGAVPIVFSGIVDPRADPPLVKSIARPEGGITGFVSYEDIDHKRLEMLAALDPRIRRIGLVVQDPSIEYDDRARRVELAKRHGIELIPVVVTEGTTAAALDALLRRQRLDAVDAPTSAFVRNHYLEIIRFARAAGIALSFRGSGFLKDGGVLSYEPLEFDYPVKAAQMIAKILQGARPEDMPIEFPSEFILSVNLSGIAALPYGINKDILRRANRVYP